MKERKKNLYRPNELVIVVCFYCIKTFIYQYVIYDIGWKKICSSSIS